ncbi:MAG: hypothetical protein ACRDGF_03000, partial [Chloroflexota bacterium]
SQSLDFATISAWESLPSSDSQVNPTRELPRAHEGAGGRKLLWKVICQKAGDAIVVFTVDELQPSPK